MKKVILFIAIFLVAVMAAISSSRKETVEVKRDVVSNMAFVVGESSNEAETLRVSASSSAPVSSDPSLIIGGKTFKLLLADTPALREQGLSGHKKLADDEAMLFVFPSPEISGFWMKDMLFSLDIVWLDSNGKIITIEPNLSPATYPKTFYPNDSAKYVIEVNAGTFTSLNTTVGDSVVFLGGK